MSVLNMSYFVDTLVFSIVRLMKCDDSYAYGCII